MSSDLDTFVESNASIANSQTPTVQSLTTGLIAAYHTKYLARVKVYATSGILAALVADGFSTSSPVYKAASAYAAAPNAPALMCVGRRALPPTQTLTLALTDGTVNDAYSFTLVGSDGKSHALSYSNVINPGAAIAGAAALSGDVTLVPGSAAIVFASAQTLTAGEVLTFSAQAGVPYTVLAATTASTAATLTTPYTGTASSTGTASPGGTALVTAGSTAVTFSVAQSLAAGSLLMFASQPGVYYALATLVSSSTSGTLTANYTGTGAAATAGYTLGVLAGTFDAIQGSAIVASTSSQVAAVAPGDSIQFTSQLGTTYTVLSVTSTVVTLTTPYTGTTGATTSASDVCKVSAAATNLAYQIGLLSNVGVVTIINSPAPAFPTVLQLVQVAGNLNDVQSWRAGGFNGINGAGNIELQDVTADPGLASDLTAMVAANGKAFYGLFLDSNSQAELEAAAAFCEAQGGNKLLFGNTSDYANGQTGVTTDVFSVLQALSYKQTFIVQDNQELLSYAGAAICGQMLAMAPGSATVVYKELPGVPADNDQTLSIGERLVINTMTAAVPGTGGKNGNFYADVDGLFTVWPGATPSGQFLDLTLGLNWLGPQIQLATVEALASLPKIPFDDFGIGAVGDAIRGQIVIASQAPYNFILPSGQDPARPITVTLPTAASLTSAQRATRSLPAIPWSAGLQGAIQTAVVNGTLIP
jgi:hypothetical protein